MLDIQFQPGSAIIAAVLVYSADGTHKRYLDFIIDTGGTSMMISKYALAKLGYTLFNKSTTQSLGAGGAFFANICTLTHFHFCGLSFKNYPVKVWNAPQNHHVVGTMGMDILRHFNIHINTDTCITTITRNNAIKWKARVTRRL